MTRNPEGAAGLALAARGVEVVKGDLDDRASLAKAFAGAYGVFAVTQPFGKDMKVDCEKEITQGKAIADVASEAKVQDAMGCDWAYVSMSYLYYWYW